MHTVQEQSSPDSDFGIAIQHLGRWRVYQEGGEIGKGDDKE